MCKFTKEKILEINEQILALVKVGFTSKQISEKLNISVATVFRVLKRLGIHIPNYHNQVKFDNTVFDRIDTEEKAYWLGFLYADGHVHNKNNSITLGVSYKDLDHLKKYKNFLKYNSKIYTQTINNKYKSCKVSVCDKHFKECLLKLGCTPKKSLVLKFPNINIFSTFNLVYDFIRGYVDGDGCLTFSRNGRLSMSILGTKEFLEGIQIYFPNKFTLHKIKRLKTNVWVLRNCGENADYVSTILYKNAKISLERKYNRFVVLCRNT